MKTIETVLRQMTDVKSIMQDLLETLREIDPEFPEAERAFLQASADLKQELRDQIAPSVGEYLAAREEEFVLELIFIGWQGFQLNLDIFKNPVNALLLKEDFEVLHRELQLKTLITAEKAREVQAAFRSALKEMPGKLEYLTEGVTEFYAYLRTAGYKIAHYFGFRLADRFLPYVVPGYMADQVSTRKYAEELKRYLQIDLDRME